MDAAELMAATAVSGDTAEVVHMSATPSMNLPYRIGSRFMLALISAPAPTADMPRSVATCNKPTSTGSQGAGYNTEIRNGSSASKHPRDENQNNCPNEARDQITHPTGTEFETDKAE